MTKKFKCPKCGNKNIEQVTYNMRRISDVVSLVGNEFLCSFTRVEGMVYNNEETFYRCSKPECQVYLGDTTEEVIKRHFHAPKLLPAPKQLSSPIPKPKSESYKIKELKYSKDDSLSTKELIDVVNFMNHLQGTTLRIRTDDHPASKACMKFIKTGRPYLFEKIY
jgi:hypothetical protein